MNDREKENGEKISVAKDFRIGRRLPHFGRALRKSGGDCPDSGGHSANRADSPEKIVKAFRSVLSFTRFISCYFISCLKKPGVFVSNVISFLVKGCCMVSDTE